MRKKPIWQRLLPLGSAFSTLLVLCSSANAQLAEFDFNSDPSADLSFSGNAEWRPDGGFEDTGYLSITDAANSQFGAIVFEDPTDGAPIGGFTFKAKFRVGGSTGDRPADGFSVSLARPTDPLLQLDPTSLAGGSGFAGTTTEASLPEEGTRTGIAIGFDEWTSAAISTANGNVADVEGISIRIDNELIGQATLPTRHGEVDDTTSLQTGPAGAFPEDLGWAEFEIVLNEGLLTIKWKDEVIVLDDGREINDLPVPFGISAGQIVFAGRTGGANSNHHVDDLSLEIAQATTAGITSFSSSRTLLTWEALDAPGSVIDPNNANIVINLDGTNVAATSVTKSGDTTTITYEPTEPFAFGSNHTYVIDLQDTNGNDITSEGTFGIASPFFPFGEDLEGAEPVGGEWAVRYLTQSDVQYANLNIALDDINRANDGTFPGTIFDTSHEVMNHGDSGAAGFFQPDIEYLTEAVDDGFLVDDFVLYGVGYLQVVEAGPYTIGVHSDDGFGLRVHGWSFDQVSGGGALDPASSDSVLFVNPTGDSNTRACDMNVEPGVYRIEFFWYERAGGDNGEIYIAQGCHQEDADTPNWRLISGDQGMVTTCGVPGVDGDGWSITSTVPGADGELANWDAAFAALEAGIDDGSALTQEYDAFNIGAGREPFPTADAGADDYAVQGTATLVIPSTGTYQFGFASDDGGFLQIEGQTFNEITTNLTGNGIIADQFGTGFDDTIICDCLTGNSQTIALIDLDAGTYTINAGYFERGGGDYGEVVAADENCPQLSLLSRNGAGTLTIPAAKAFLSPSVPGGLPFQICAISLADGEATVTFNSKPGNTYTIERSTDLSGADNGFIELEDGFEAAEGEETTDYVDEAVPASGEVYYRIREES